MSFHVINDGLSLREAEQKVQPKINVLPLSMSLDKEEATSLYSMCYHFKHLCCVTQYCLWAIHIF